MGTRKNKSMTLWIRAWRDYCNCSHRTRAVRGYNTPCRRTWDRQDLFVCLFVDFYLHNTMHSRYVESPMNGAQLRTNSTDRNAISYEGPSCINTRVTFKVTVWVDNRNKLSLLSLFKMSVSVTTRISLYKGTTTPKARWQEIDRDSIRLDRQLSL